MISAVRTIDGELQTPGEETGPVLREPPIPEPARRRASYFRCLGIPDHFLDEMIDVDMLVKQPFFQLVDAACDVVCRGIDIMAAPSAPPSTRKISGGLKYRAHRPLPRRGNIENNNP